MNFIEAPRAHAHGIKNVCLLAEIPLVSRFAIHLRAYARRIPRSGIKKTIFCLGVFLFTGLPAIGSEGAGPNPGNLTPAGSNSVSLYTGAFTYTYPIQLPAGRNGMTPDLKLTGKITKLNAQLAVTCIGYQSAACCTANPTNGVFANGQGRISEGLYVVGWAKRGPSGTIPNNRTEAQQVAERIAQETADGCRAGGAGLRQLLETRRVVWVDYAGWRRIDAAELAAPVSSVAGRSSALWPRCCIAGQTAQTASCRANDPVEVEHRLQPASARAASS